MFGWVCECGFDSYPMRPRNLCTGNDRLKTVVPLIYTALAWWVGIAEAGFVCISVRHRDTNCWATTLAFKLSVVNLFPTPISPTRITFSVKMMRTSRLGTIVCARYKILTFIFLFMSFVWYFLFVNFVSNYSGMFSHVKVSESGPFPVSTHCWSNLILISSSLSYTLTSYQSVLMFRWFPLYFITVPEVSLCKLETKWINWVRIMSSIMTWRVNESIEINIGIDVMNFSSWTGNWSQN